MNVVTVAGRVGKDSESKVAGQNNVLVFSVADDMFGDKGTIWWECNLWGGRGDKLQQYITKGAVVTVTGAAEQRTYTNKDGQEVKVLSIRVNDVALQGGKKAESEAPRKEPARKAAPARASADMDDDVPF